MNPRKWDANITNRTPIGELRNEHDATVQQWQDSQAELERIGKINDSLCDTMAALPTIRVPFTDEQIEKMARAHHEAAPAAMAAWPSLSPTTQKILMSAIRAALAAGGLEPCPVPEYKPKDVALNVERTSDEELATLAQDTMSAFQNGWQDVAAAIRTRVEAPLLAEIAELQADREATNELYAMRDNEFAASQARVAELEGLQDVQIGYNLEWSQRSTSQRAEIESLRAELEAAKAERGQLQDQARRYKKDYHAALGEAQELRAELAALRQPEPVPVKVRFSFCDDHEALKAVAQKHRLSPVHMEHVAKEIATHAVIDVPPGVPSVEELANDMLAAAEHFWFTNHTIDMLTPDYRRDAIRIATAIRDRVLAGVAGEKPISIEAKTDAVIDSLGPELEYLVDEYLRGYVEISGEPIASISYSRTGLRYVRDAVLASRPAPTSTPTDTLEKLAEIATDAYTRAPAPDWGARMQYVVAAILRAAKAEVDIKYHDLIEALNNHNTEVSNEEWDRTFQDLLNSRIRYRVELPETAAAGWELDVTAEELRGHCITSNAEEFLTYLKSRIRPAACKECATWKTTYERDKAAWDDRASRAVRALEGE